MAVAEAVQRLGVEVGHGVAGPHHGFDDGPPRGLDGGGRAGGRDAVATEPGEKFGQALATVGDGDPGDDQALATCTC